MTYLRIANKAELLEKELVEGSVVAIYSELDEIRVGVEFMAKLLKRIPSTSFVPYPFIEKSIRKTVNVIKEKWLVEIISDDRFLNGKQLVRNIPVYHSTGLIHIKDEYEDEEE